MISWVRRHWRYALSIGVGTLALILLVVLWILRKQRAVQALQNDLAISRSTAIAYGLEADKKARAKELAKNAEEAAILDKQIIEAKRRVIAVDHDVANLADEDIVRTFHQMGY